MLYDINQLIQIVNHADPECNGKYGIILNAQVAYDGYTYYYDVMLEDSDMMCVCTDDEIMEA